MTGIWRRLAQTIEADGAAGLVQVIAVSGSAPREAGAAMVVRRDGGFWGTIGGGALEYAVLAEARAALAVGRGPAQRRDWPLGPDLGQCCGGRITTLVETFDAADLSMIRRLAAAEATGPLHIAAKVGADGRVERHFGESAGESWTERYAAPAYPLLLFGAGHVGRALTLALAPLPVAVRWIDPRADIFPSLVPGNATPCVSGEPASEIAAAAPGSAVLVMTHSHPLDLAVVAAALARADLGPVGLIGSATKRARFMMRLRAAGLEPSALHRLVCPIGLPGIGGKEPAVIAASVAAQVLLWREEFSQGRDEASVRDSTDRRTGRANPARAIGIEGGRRAGGHP